MTLSMHAASAPILARMLTSLAAWLDQAQADCEAKGVDPATLLTSRLAPDMLPFDAQVKIAADIGRMTLARLAGTELSKWPDEPASLAALAARVRETVVQVEAFDAAAVDAGQTREIVLPQRGGDPLRFEGLVFLQRWALPNFFFHVTTAYALLRHAGVPLGKADYLGLGRA
jgi:uncharacterized protein